MPPLILSAVFYAGFLVVSSGLYVAKSTGGLPWIALGATAVNILLDLVWIPRLGYVGAGWASAGANLFLVLLAWRLAARRRRIRFRLLAWGIAVAASGLVLAILPLVPLAGVGARLSLKTALLLLALTLLVRGTGLLRGRRAPGAEGRRGGDRRP